MRSETAGAAGAENLKFLSGGGEMGALTRQFNWSATSLGSPQNWPQSLKTAVGILLHSRFPMFLFWGPDLICFYNDAYRPSLGNNGKHPEALGSKGVDVWPEIWDVIKPLIDTVMTEGEASWSEDQLIPIYRNGKLEDVYWTFSYSPVHEESGAVNGVFVTCVETTERIERIHNILQSETEIRHLIEQAPVGITTYKGPDFIIDTVNSKSLEIWHKRSEEVLGRPLFEVAPELREQGFDKALENTYRNGASYHTDEIVTRIERNGKEEALYFNATVQPVYEPDGSISGVITIATDVTDQVLSRQQIEYAEERLRLAAEAGGLGTFDYDMVRDVTVTSDKFHELYGFTRPPTRQEIVDLIHPDDMGIRELAFQEAYKTGRLTYTARVMLNPVRWIRVDGKLYFDQDRKPIRMLGTVADVTKDKEFNEKLEKIVAERTAELALSNLQLQQSNEELRQFAYIASHDLQEPLRKVRTFVGMLEHKLPEKDDETKRLIERISASSLRMLTLIKDVLNFSQLGIERRDFEPVDLNVIVANVRSDFELLAEQKGASIINDPLPTVDAISLQMNQLFSNLIGNALKFTSMERSPVISVTVHKEMGGTGDIEDLAKGRRYYRIEFRDNGIGFKQEYAEQIFTIFQRLHNKQSYSGTGIGLALCRKIAVNHHGKIIAESVEGEGTVFKVWLPETQESAFLQDTSL